MTIAACRTICATESTKELCPTRLADKGLSARHCFAVCGMNLTRENGQNWITSGGGNTVWVFRRLAKRSFRFDTLPRAVSRKISWVTGDLKAAARINLTYTLAASLARLNYFYESTRHALHVSLRSVQIFKLNSVRFFSLSSLSPLSLSLSPAPFSGAQRLIAYLRAAVFGRAKNSHR